MIKLILNIIFAITGSIYFWFYYVLGYEHTLELYFVDFPQGVQLFSFFNGVLGFLVVLGIIGLFTKVFEYFYNKYYPKNIFLSFFIKIIRFTKYFLALRAFSHFAIVSQEFHLILKQVYYIGIFVIFLFSLTTIINNILKYKVLRNPKVKLQPEFRTLIPFINKVVVAIIWILGIISIFSNLGYNVNAFIAGAGIGGLAIAFAAQKSIAQIFGAITILLNKPFKVGDYVKINGIVGTVKVIGLTYVELTEMSGYKVMIPNDVILSGNIENFTERRNRRTEVLLQIEYKTPTAKVEKGVEAIKQILQTYVDDGTISSFRVSFAAFGQFSLDINILYFSLLNSDFDLYVLQKEEINYEIKETIEKLGIKMAYPNNKLFNILGESSNKKTALPDNTSVPKK